MKRVIRAGAIGLVLAATTATVAVASGGLSGSYKTTITRPAFLRGSYRITFTPGHFTVHGPSGYVAHGTDRVSGSRITIRGGGKCGSPGTYSFKRSGRSLTFKKIKDPCPRAPLITAHSWTKA
jgi:hypothetical protein